MPITNYFLNVSLSNFNIMKGLFNSGWSANKVQSWMKDNVTGYRRSTVQAVKLEVMGMVKHQYSWEHKKKDTIPTKSYFDERDFRAPYTYWIHYEADLLNEVTGEYETKQLSHFADTLRTTQSWEDEILASLNPANYKDVMSFSNIHIKNVDHQAGMAY